MYNNQKILKDLRVLCVEDDLNLSKLLKDALGEYFFSFSIASNPLEGIEKFIKINPDIVITDIMMSKFDGLDMTKKIKEINDKTPIIVLSAFSHRPMLLKAIDIGITKYFIKPFNPEEVLEYLIFLAKKINKQRIVCLSKNFSFDLNTKSLFKNNTLLNITKREKGFILLLLENKIVSSEIMKEKLWDEDGVSQERIRTFIKRLRGKTSKDLIKNISGQGYTISKDMNNSP